VKIEVHNPAVEHGIYPADDYVHAVSVSGASRTLYVAGTMGLRPDLSAGAGIDEQLDLIWRNIRTILASAGMTVDNIVRLTSYLRDPAYMEKNAKARLAALGGRKIPTTAIVAQTLSPDWLVEIEVIAVS
jgi:enamine deaminase RidA (YjgF/YER057c/UK114 family)